ncbi:NAD(P)-dependent oxidoreductase [Jiangella asiatica]|uniref:C-terminal binding protein n=1 Tax=Jiangella asiatica TaxID=2530372 RepID=A0A4R5DKK4_9ACTN|nr:NAD(P)-dependent oxidoreductase [Jiangella asiatica]TDE11163.1 C-terminal binding protein [Jiangella asiatica]
MTDGHWVVITDTNLGDGSHERAELGDAFTVTRHHVTTEDEVIEVGRGADALMVQWAPITGRVLESLPGLRAVVRYGIGLDNVDLEAARRLGIKVGNVDDYCIDEVADHAAAAIHAHSRRLVSAARSFAERGWTTEGIAEPVPLREDVVGLAGFGRIGRGVATRLRGLGFPVQMWDPFVTDVPAGITVAESLEELANAANHLSLHLALTRETEHVVTGAVLDALGPSGHLVNTARGGLVDEAALLAALEAGQVGFASLDVLASEPPTGVSARLAAHPRVLVTPHVAYLSTGSLPQLRIRAAHKVRELLGADDQGVTA